MTTLPLGYTQCFVTVMAFLVDGVLCTQYAVAFLLCFLLLEQPSGDAAAAHSGVASAASGEGSGSSVETLTPVTFRDLAKAEAAGVAHLVFLHTRWSLPCRHVYSTYSELARRFSTDKVRFASLDLSGEGGGA